MNYEKIGDNSSQICIQAFPEAVIWKYFVEICLGLFVLHSNRILHRDIKAANLFVGENDTVKVRSACQFECSC